MIQWPPSPTVEDEATALAKEHKVTTIAESVKPEDQPVPSRGDIDQLPIIVDTDTNTDPPVDRANKSARGAEMISKRAEKPGPQAVFRDETGLPTPPPSDNEMRGRGLHTSFQSDKDHTGRVPRSKSTARVEDINPSRPTISRIQTDVDGELNRLKAGMRQPPSPYSYTRETGTFKVDAELQRPTEHLLSPMHTAASPMTLQQKSTQQGNAHDKDCDSSTDSERKPKKSLRFAETHLGPTSQPHQPQKTATETERHKTEKEAQLPRKVQNNPLDATSSRSQLREESRPADEEVSRRAHRSRSRAARSSSRPRESPQPLPAEELVKKEPPRSTRQSGSDEQPVRRRSSHRRERPRLGEPFESSSGVREFVSSDDDATRRVYRIRDGRGPMTPPTVTTPNHMEDYFSRAFHENALKPPRYTPRSSADETAVYSPPRSPPKTPRSERPPTQDYFQSPSSSPQRQTQRSRPPSLEESQFRDLKAHTSLLSQATATAAALASRVSPPTSRSASATIDTGFAPFNNGGVAKPRSRASSPQRDRAARSNASTYSEPTVMMRPQYPPVAQSSRPNTRDGLPKIELPGGQPQRNASWTGYEPHQRPQNGQSNGSPHNLSPMSNVQPNTGLKVAPTIHRSQSASAPNEITQTPSEIQLPPCPRSHPVQGLRDWCTVRDIPNFDVCPKCIHFLASTRFRHFFVRSHDQRYDEYTACALSRPWIRIAFTQALKQNKSDLSFIKKANTLPEGARPCEGSTPDVRMWWKLIDPAIDRAVPDFFACSACVGAVHDVFPDLPDQFKRDIINQEKTCILHAGSKHFQSLIEQLDAVSMKCRDRGKSSARYMQPFVDHVRRITSKTECARDKMLINRPWHFSSDLPEFTICESCFVEVVWPVQDKHFARDISRATRPVPASAFKGSGSNHSVTPDVSKSVYTHPTSCQLYSERMRRMFADVVSGRMAHDVFKIKAKERQAAQYRLNEMNRMYEEDQKMGWDRRADVEKNKAYWRSLE